MDPNGNCPPQLSGLGDDVIECASDLNVSDGCPNVSAVPASHATASDGDNGPSAEQAPLELLASLLTSVTEKDYETALKRCREILDYEPHNVTAHRFMLLIGERIQLNAEHDESEDDESYDDVDTETSSDDDSTTTETSEKETDEDDATTVSSSYGTDDDVASEDGLVYDALAVEAAYDGEANGTAYNGQANGTAYKADEAGQAFPSTSSDALLTTGQSSGEAIDRLRAKVVPSKASDKKE